MSVWRHLRRLGGPGLVLLGIADNSVIPLTGSMDVLTIWLAARHREPWPYYALMATLGAVIGGYITYALARKGGKETMERKLSKKRTQQVSGHLSAGDSPRSRFLPCCRHRFLSCRFCWPRAPCSTQKRNFGSPSPRPRHSLLRRRRPGIPLWQPYPAFLLQVLQTGAGHPHRIGGDRRGGLADSISPNERRSSRTTLAHLEPVRHPPLELKWSTCLSPSRKPWRCSSPMT